MLNDVNALLGMLYNYIAYEYLRHFSIIEYFTITMHGKGLYD